MHDYFFSLPGNLTMHFQTACDITDDKTRLQLGAYIPGLTLMEDEIPHPDLTVTHIQSKQSHLICDGDRVEVGTPKSNALPADLYHLLYGIVRKKLATKDMFCVHAACVGRDNQYSLIVGHSGSGKTTLVHNLIFAHDMKLFSGNKTVIRFTDNKSIEAIAGTKTMTALDDDRNRYSYEMPEQRYAEQDIVPITSISLIRINEGVKECDELEPLSALHTLYPFFMDSVNSDVIVGGQHIYNGAPDEVDKSLLTEQLSGSLKKTPVKKLSGDVMFLQQQLKLG